MGSSFLSVVGSIATVALIVIATRWLSGAKGSQLPKTRDGASVYGIKWQWQTVGLVGGVFWVVVSIWSWRDHHARPDGVLIAITVAFVAAGIWLARGSRGASGTHAPFSGKRSLRFDCTRSKAEQSSFASVLGS